MGPHQGPASQAAILASHDPGPRFGQGRGPAGASADGQKGAGPAGRRWVPVPAGDVMAGLGQAAPGPLEIRTARLECLEFHELPPSATPKRIFRFHG
jgi:hypothetical protein